jgi:hypothetical protein
MMVEACCPTSAAAVQQHSLAEPRAAGPCTGEQILGPVPRGGCAAQPVPAPWLLYNMSQLSAAQAQDLECICL